MENNDSIQVKFNDSFVKCINYITKIPVKEFKGKEFNNNLPNWYNPHIKKLTEKYYYDMIFFSIKPPLKLSDEFISNSIIGNEKVYKFNLIPSGKCIIMAKRKSSILHCMVGIVNKDKEINIIYDPYKNYTPDTLIEVGFFIKTFLDEK
jgi:hypothetical protein